MSSEYPPPKILAPAGGRSEFFAAIQAGADGIYLGLKSFSARASAQNFTLSDLEELVPLAQKFDIEVLVALNTIVEQREMESLPPILGSLSDIGISGIIAQDLGVAHLVRSHFNQLPLHASTQMAIHSLEGVRAAKKLGFKRVVLARELTLSEISQIRAEFPSQEMELEIFCHGSLCYAYSGLCLFGGVKDGRSGNKGQCPYPCRRLYATGSKQSHTMSMRDLNTLDILSDIVRTGADVLKIEGRKKDAQYVTATVQSYRSRLNAIFGRNTLRKNAPSVTLPPENILAEERSYSFQRSTTTLFMGAKPNHEATTLDLSATTHLGTPIGVVSFLDASGITFQTLTELTLHDGLSIETSGEAIGCGVSKMFVNGKSVTTVQPGTVVTVAGAFPCTAQNARIFKTRSDKLRSRVDALTRPPHDERLRPILPFHLTVEFEFSDDVTQERVVLKLTAKKKNETVLEKRYPLEFTRPSESSEDWLEKLLRSVTQTFSLFGDFNRAATVQIMPPAQPLFLLPSLLKKAKREFGSELAAAFSLWRDGLTQKAAHALALSITPETQPHAHHKPSLLIKTDSFSVAQSLPPDNTIFAINSRFLNSPLPHESLSSKVRIALPLICRATETQKLRNTVQWFLKNNHRSFAVGGLGTLQILKECAAETFLTLKVHAEASLYARNSLATKQLSQMGFCQFTLSHEESPQNLATRFFQSDLPFSIVVQSNLALMHSENCIKKALRENCEGALCDCSPIAMTDAHDRTFLAYRDGCRTVVTAQDEFSLLSKWSHYKDLGAAEIQAELLWKPHTPEDAQELLFKLISLTQQ